MQLFKTGTARRTSLRLSPKPSSVRRQGAAEHLATAFLYLDRALTVTCYTYGIFRCGTALFATGHWQPRGSDPARLGFQALR